MMKCTICFESTTGIRPSDYFVATNNGHMFHYSCALEYIAGGSFFCPICDEDLRFHTFVKLNSKGLPAPKRPPKPGRSTSSSDSSTNGERRSPTPTPTGSISVNWNDPWQLDNNPQSSTQAQLAAPTQPFASFAVQPDYVFKIVVLGNFQVGKSSLLQRYADEKFDPFLQLTIGCDLRVKVIPIAGKIIRLNLWDTAGQERHRAVVDMYLRKADGVIFCFDITDHASFLALEDWYQFSQRALSSNTLKIIVGTKSDLWSQRVVRSRQVQALAERWNSQYIYTSAKDAVNVEIVFRSLAALILEQRLPSSYNNASTIPSAPPPEPHQSSTNSEGTIKLYDPFKNTKKEKKKSSDCCKI